MSANKVAAANDALWQLVSFTFGQGWTTIRNPVGNQAPKTGVNGVAQYADQMDDMQPEVLRVMCGPVYDLKITPHVSVVFLGGTEAARRAAAWSGVESLKAALAQDRTLTGAVEYARVEAADDAGADRLAWMAGGLRVPVALLFNAPSEAG